MIENVIEVPDFNKIRELEKISFSKGSGVTYEDLIGEWYFKYVWKKGQNKIDNISSSILQVLSATLELSEVDIKKEKLSLNIKNSIKCGLITIIFSGKAFLKGERPLLIFYFEAINLKFGKITIFKNSFKKMQEKQMPFFSLISIEKDRRWLCARGKGGGIAIWVK